MNAKRQPIKAYAGKVSYLVIFLGTVGILLFLQRRVGAGFFDPPVLVFSAIVSVIAGMLGGLGGRRWVALYEDHLELRGPLSRLLKWGLGLDVWVRRIPYRDIVRLGRFFVEGPRGSYLIIHHRSGSRTRRFRVEVVGRERYADFKAEMVKRVAPGCELYSTKGFGKPRPF
jgi:hypothetical protein